MVHCGLVQSVQSVPCETFHAFPSESPCHAEGGAGADVCAERVQQRTPPEPEHRAAGDRQERPRQGHRRGRHIAEHEDDGGPSRAAQLLKERHHAILGEVCRRGRRPHNEHRAGEHGNEETEPHVGVELPHSFDPGRMTGSRAIPRLVAVM